MKKVMKFVKGKKDEDKETQIRNIPLPESKKPSIDKSEESFKDDDFIYRDKSVTKLHKAVWNENSEKLKCIIKTHDIDITDRLDRTSLYFAVLKDNPNIVNLLLENSANQNIPDIDGITPFLKSVQLGYRDCASILLDHGADLKKTDKDSNTCLHYAIMADHIDMLSFLLEQNIDCNISNANGDYPMHIAIKMNNIQMIELLLNHKSDLNLVNSSGLTAMKLAEELNNSDIVSLLENYNFSIKNLNLAPDDNSLTACSSHKSSYENLKSEKYFGKNDSETTDTWNDSPVCTPIKVVKPERPEKPIRMSKHFFNERSDIVEEKSGSDVSVKCSENTSPQSGIIPPPCKPLRSLEYLQSGLAMENRSVHLLTLGTVRTRHISMTESDHSKNNTPQRYSYQGDYVVPCPVDGVTNKNGEEKPDSLKSKLLSKLEYDSTVQSDWDSDESLPLDELSFGRKDKSVTSSTSKNTSSNSGSIRSRTADSFLQKQFSILEDFERNSEKRCSVSYEMDVVKPRRGPCGKSGAKLENIEDILEDNSRINNQLEKYAGQSTLQRTAKSKSLPRNCEPYSSYHKGSFSLPRTLESGKDPFREMRSCGNFKPRSHFFSLKMLKGDKKNSFLDKLKSMFNKKSQVYLTDQSDSQSNGSWLYKEKYKIRSDHEFYNQTQDGGGGGGFSASETSSSRRSHHSDGGAHDYDLDLKEVEQCEEGYSYNDKNKVFEKNRLLLNNMNPNGNSGRKACGSPDNKYKVSECKNVNCRRRQQNQEEKSQSQRSEVLCAPPCKETNGEQNSPSPAGASSSNTKLCLKSPCDECLDNLAVKLTSAEQTIVGKDKLICLLQSQLEQLKNRNLKSIDEAQNIFLQFGITQQKLEATEQKCAQYDEEMQRLRSERCNQAEQDQMAQRFKEDALRWKKQYEELLEKLQVCGSSSSKAMDDELNWRQSLQNEVTKAVTILTENSQTVINSLEKQNKKLEDYCEKLQEELNHAQENEIFLQNELRGIHTKFTEISARDAEVREKFDKTYEDRVKTMQEQNSKLQEELESVTREYKERQKEYDYNLNALQQQIYNISNSKEKDILKSQLEEKLEIIRDLKGRLGEAEQRNSKLKDSLLESAHLERHLSSSLQNIESAFASERDKNEHLELQIEKIENLEDILDKEIEKNAYLLVELQNAKDKLEKMQSENIRLMKAKGELAKDIAEVKNKCDMEACNNKANLCKLKNQVKELTCENKEMQENISQLETELDNANQSLEKTNENLQKCACLEKQNKLLQKENGKLKDTILTQATQILTLDDIVKKLQSKIASLCTECKENKEAKENSDKGRMQLLDTFGNDKKILGEKIQELEAENLRLQKKMIEFDSKVSSSILGVPLCPDLVSKSPPTSEDEFNCDESCANYEDVQTTKASPSEEEKKKMMCIVNSIESKVCSLSESYCKNGDKAASLPNLEAIKQNKDFDALAIEEECCPQVMRKAPSVDSACKKIIVCTPGSTSSSTTNDTCFRKGENRWGKQIEVVQKLRNELTEVLANLDIKSTQLADECAVPNCTNQFKLVADSLQRQVNELNMKSADESLKCYGLKAEIVGLKGNMVAKDQMEEEIRKLRKELYKQKVESVQEIEKARIKKEAEILEIQYQLREKFLANKLKLLADLSEVQIALKMKSSTHMQLKEKCDQLIEEITVNQEVRKKKVQEIIHQTDSIQSINLEKGLRDIFQPGQVPREQTPDIPEETNAPCETISNVRAKLNSTIEKHRLDTDSVPNPPHLGDGDTEAKYLLK